MPVRTAYNPVAGEVLTDTNLEKLAGGWIGYNEVTADQGGITTETDLTTLTVAVTVGPSRRIRITGSIMPRTSVANDTCRLSIKEGATVLQFRDVIPSFANSQVFLDASVVLAPSTGAHTYKLTLTRATGTGTLISGASATNPAWILAEDVGPAS